jgi:TRAP-type transport system periplasmic protein
MKTVLRHLMIIVVSVFVLQLTANESVGDSLNLRYVGSNPDYTFVSELASSWSQEIGTRTGGEVSITYYPVGRGIGIDDVYDAVSQGVIDIGMFFIDLNDLTAMEALSLPLGFSSGSETTTIANAFYGRFQPFAELSQVKVLYFCSFGPDLLHTTSPVQSLVEIYDKKIRSTTATQTEVLRALGANPRSLPYPDIPVWLTYHGDGVLFPMSVVYSYSGIGRVVKYTTKTYSVGNSWIMCVAMNKALWNSASMTNDIKKVFEDVSREWISKHGVASDNADMIGENYALSLGNQMLSLSEAETSLWSQRVQSVIDAYITKANGQGLPGNAYVNFLKEQVLSQCSECSDSPVVLTNTTFSSGRSCECSDAVSITLGSGVTIKSGATVIFQAPRIITHNGFHAETGSVVKMEQ